MTYRKEMRSQKQHETELKEKQMQNTSKTQEGLTNLYKIRHQQEQTQQLIQQH